MSAIQPSLRDLGNTKLVPALKRRAIIMMSLGDKKTAFVRASSLLNPGAMDLLVLVLDFVLDFEDEDERSLELRLNLH